MMIRTDKSLFTTTILGIVVLREVFGLSDIIGAILILGGIALHRNESGE